MIMLKDKTCCFSGHRKMPPEILNSISRRLTNLLIRLINDGYRYYGVGGALGFDTLAAQTIIELRKSYTHIKLILVLPCRSQADKWAEKDKKMYEYIKEQADKIVYTSEEYTSGCMHKRNRHLVDNSSICICYLTKDNGGTAYTVRYAKSKGLKVENIAEK